MIWKLKCRKHRAYKRVRKTSCCLACRFAWWFNRGRMTRTPKPDLQQKLKLNLVDQAHVDQAIKLTRSQHQETLP